MRITWKELIAEVDVAKLSGLFDKWGWLIPPSMEPFLISAIGDVFFKDGGKIYWLDAGAAQLTMVADTSAEFDLKRQQTENANDWFLPLLVGDLIEAGLFLEKNQVFSYKVQPTLGGEYEVSNFEVCDVEVHFSLLGQIQKQIHDLPEGTPIGKIVLED